MCYVPYTTYSLPPYYISYTRILIFMWSFGPLHMLRTPSGPFAPSCPGHSMGGPLRQSWPAHQGGDSQKLRGLVLELPKALNPKIVLKTCRGFQKLRAILRSRQSKDHSMWGTVFGVPGLWNLPSEQSSGQMIVPSPPIPHPQT